MNEPDDVSVERSEERVRAERSVLLDSVTERPSTLPERDVKLRAVRRR